MKLHRHTLTGCSPAPLINYLKAFGIMRALSDEADPAVRGRWVGPHFELLTKLNRDELEGFFLHKFKPLPLMSPWNKGSGLLSDYDKAVSPMEASTAPRFADIREAIATAKKLASELSALEAEIGIIKDEPKSLPTKERTAYRQDEGYKSRLSAAERKFAAAKGNFIAQCHASWRGPMRRWLEAAVVLPDPDDKPVFPALLGSGGNDGRLDFTNNALQRIGELFDLEDPEGAPVEAALGQLQASLWATPQPSALSAAAVGQYQPGQAGGANATAGPEGSALVNPWDFILGLDGAVLFRSAIARRLGSHLRRSVIAPFAVFGQPLGYASASEGDKHSRNEQWMPLWDQFASLPELSKLLAEARTNIGRRAASRPLDVARAIGELGVDRGLTAFQRFGYLERNGQANIAVDLGSFSVGLARPNAQLLDDLADWLDYLNYEAKKDTASGSLREAERAASQAAFACATQEAKPYMWQRLLLAVGSAQDLIRPGGDPPFNRLPALSSRWLEALDDGSAELRLALSFAHAASSWERGKPIGPSSDLIAPRYPNGRLNDDPQLARGVLPATLAPLAAMKAAVRRRLVTQPDQEMFPFAAAPGRGPYASLHDLSLFLYGHLDLDLLWRLSRALTLVKRSGDRSLYPRHNAEPQSGLPRVSSSWAAIRLALSPVPLEPGGQAHNIPLDPAIFNRLDAGDLPRATQIATQRLRSSGVHTPFNQGLGSAADAELAAASLVFPISSRSAALLMRQLNPFNSPQNNKTEYSNDT